MTRTNPCRRRRPLPGVAQRRKTGRAGSGLRFAAAADHKRSTTSPSAITPDILGERPGESRPTIPRSSLRFRQLRRKGPPLDGKYGSWLTPDPHSPLTGLENRHPGSTRIVGSNPTPAAHRAKSRTVEPKRIHHDYDSFSPPASADVHRDVAGLALKLALEGCVSAGNAPHRRPRAAMCPPAMVPDHGRPSTTWRACPTQ